MLMKEEGEREAERDRGWGFIFIRERTVRSGMTLSHAFLVSFFVLFSDVAFLRSW